MSELLPRCAFASVHIVGSLASELPSSMVLLLLVAMAAKNFWEEPQSVIIKPLRIEHGDQCLGMYEG